MYERSVGNSFWSQTDNDHYPKVTDDPCEVLDPTFYTVDPPTSSLINPLITQHGGNGIVVSRRECLEMYQVTKELLRGEGIELPNNSDLIREWSLVMAIVGVLEGIKRGLLTSDTDVVVHGSGFYTDEMLEPMMSKDVTQLADASGLRQMLLDAVR